MKEEKTFHQESGKAFTWLQFDESQQTTFCSQVFMVNCRVTQLKGKYKRALNFLYYYFVLQIIMSFEPIHPFVSLPHLVAVLSIVKEQIRG